MTPKQAKGLVRVIERIMVMVQQGYDDGDVYDVLAQLRELVVDMTAWQK